MEKFEELEFEGCKKNRKSLDFERSTIVDYILGSKNSKIQKRIEEIRLAKMRKVLDCGGVSSKD